MIEPEKMIGCSYKKELRVTTELIATRIGSGNVDVFATPMMIALMESAAADCCTPFMEEGMTTVATEVRVSHISATPVGMMVTATAEIIAVEGKRIDFEVKAYDTVGLIGEGIHSRVIVDKERFEQKAQAKKHQ